MPPKIGSARSKSVGGAKKSVAPADPLQDLRNMEGIHEVLAKAQSLRNYFQVERDKVNNLWDVTKAEVTNEQFRLSNAESELEELERNHQVEMKVYKQKVRHLLYDHKTEVQQAKVASDTALQQADAAHDLRVKELETDRQHRLSAAQSLKEVHEGRIIDQRDSHQYMLTVTKKRNHEKEVTRLQALYEGKMSTLREDLELRRRAEIQDVEERYHQHLNKLIQQHETKFGEMKAYYNNITRNNLEIIASLKEEIVTMKNNDEQNESLMYEIERENSTLVSPLEQIEKEVAELQEKKRQHFQDKQSLLMARGRLKMLQQQVNELRQAKESLEEQYKKVYDEREELKAKFELALRDAMGVVAERNNSLEQQLLEAYAHLEQRDAQLGGVLHAMNIEPAAMELISGEIDNEVQTKNQIIKDLHFELRKLEKKMNAVVLEYERRCRTVGLLPLDRASVMAA